MKTLLVLFALLLLFQCSFSQCDELLNTEEDPFNGTKITYTDIVVVSNDGNVSGFSMYYQKSSKSNSSLIFVVKFVDDNVRCIDEGDEMYLLFDDGSVSIIKNEADFNCKGKLVVYFDSIYGNLKPLKMLAKKKLTRIRLTGSSFYEMGLSEENSKDLLNDTKCITDGVF